MEHKSQKILSNKKFAIRLLRYNLFAFLLILISIIIGVIGYRYYGNLSWIDSFQMACLILTGMGPTNEMTTDSSRYFRLCMPCIAALLFLTITAIVFTPIVHRLLHILHIEDTTQND
ncbi:MAG: hypothetical protein IPN46_19845 [Saprospiraceae bacterium]|nr:hypothetical protein [Saprospiraceae bacterium]